MVFFHCFSSQRLGLQNDCAGLLEAQVARTLQGNEKTMAAIPGHAPGKPTEDPWKTHVKILEETGTIDDHWGSTEFDIVQLT